MKTSALVVMSAFLVSAAVPVFAMTHQEKLACAMTAGNCLNRDKLLGQKIVEIKNEIKKNEKGSPEVTKNLEIKLQDTMAELKRVEDDIN
ncbi:MAG: hypothetical protein M0T70_13085 [Geobacteraceae bacterium]|nr:hypothetical protein [Geobacteraceae bacterium]